MPFHAVRMLSGRAVAAIRRPFRRSPSDPFDTSKWLPVIVVGIIALTVGTTIAGFIVQTDTQRRLSALRIENRGVRIVQTALLEVETGARGFVLSSRMDYLQPYIAGLQALENSRPVIATLDQFVSETSGTPEGTRTFTALLAHFRSEVGKMIELAQRGSLDLDGQRAHLDRTKAAMDTLRGYTDQLLATRTEEANKAEDELAGLQKLVLVLQIISGTAVFAALILAFRGMARQSRGRALAVAQAIRSREQVEHLLSMADMLQSAVGYEDANAVLSATARRLLPGLGGALYIFNNSRDRLDLSTVWSSGGATPAVPDVITPAQCWALKRGKPQLNVTAPGSLQCGHALDAKSTLEVPMLARGEVYGLLQVFSEDPAGADLEETKELAFALADSMSLALSSIALRERLRNQALRDPLTGLYNRRFMEEVLDKLTLQAERRKSPISAIMIDLDHFKKLNDRHGHAAGDTVLRDVAGVILSSLRKSDIACRYGGEELFVILPDSDLESTRAKAEGIRAKIAELSSIDGVSVSASMGVATIPETSATPAELTAMADKALYEAKQAGRNMVVAAPQREPARSQVADLR